MQEQGNTRVLVDLMVVQESSPGCVTASQKLFYFCLHLSDLICKHRKCEYEMIW